MEKSSGAMDEHLMQLPPLFKGFTGGQDKATSVQRFLCVGISLVLVTAISGQLWFREVVIVVAFSLLN